MILACVYADEGFSPLFFGTSLSHLDLVTSSLNVEVCMRVYMCASLWEEWSLTENT